MKKNLLVLCAMLTAWSLSELSIDHNPSLGTTSVENEASDCYVVVSTDDYNACIALMTAPANEAGTEELASANVDENNG